MKSLLISAAILIGFISSVIADSEKFAVTPESLNQGGCQFSVNTNSVQDGVAFHVVIKNSRSDIYSDQSAALDTVTQKQVPAGESEESIGPVKQTVLVMLKKAPRCFEWVI